LFKGESRRKDTGKWRPTGIYIMREGDVVRFIQCQLHQLRMLLNFAGTSRGWFHWQAVAVDLHYPAFSYAGRFGWRLTPRRKRLHVAPCRVDRYWVCWRAISIEWFYGPVGRYAALRTDAIRTGTLLVE
jgi:hypothetical protein